MKNFIYGLSLVFWMSSAVAEPFPVVVSFSILSDMVKTVGGDRVQVTTIVGPNQDTHVYEPKPKDAKLLSSARMVFINGLGFEGWMERLVEASGFKGQMVVAAQGVPPLIVHEDGKEICKHEGGCNHKKGFDPHAWHSPDNALIYVDNIVAALSELDPQSAPDFKKRGEDYKTQIREMSTWARTELESVPVPQRKVITAHDAFQYMGQAYGIKFLAPVGVSTDAEPSAKTIASLLKQIKSEGVRAVFIENVANPRVIQQISDEAGVKIFGVLYSDALSLEGGEADTYLKMMRHNITVLIKAMTGGDL